MDEFEKRIEEIEEIEKRAEAHIKQADKLDRISNVLSYVTLFILTLNLIIIVFR